jgi:hypothetical protein
MSDAIITKIDEMQEKIEALERSVGEIASETREGKRGEIASETREGK